MWKNLPDSYTARLELPNKRIIFMIRFKNCVFYGKHGEDGGGVVWRSYKIEETPPPVPYTGPWGGPGGFGWNPYGKGKYGR